MRRADRLFQIIQILRRTTQPVTAAALAEELEVSKRTVYRDVGDMIGQRVPIEGSAGFGYVLASEYDMPPLMLTPDEIEAVVLGAQWVAGHSDKVLSNAARDVVAKIATVVPEDLRPYNHRAERWGETGDRAVRGERRYRKPQIGDPQWSEIAAPLPLRGWHRNRSNGMAGHPRLCRDEPLAGRLVRAPSELPAFPHRPNGQFRGAR